MVTITANINKGEKARREAAVGALKKEALQEYVYDDDDYYSDAMMSDRRTENNISR